MKIPINHPQASEIEFHDGSLRLEYTLRDAQGNAIGPRTTVSVSIGDDYTARKFAESLGLNAGPTESRWRVSKDTIISRVTAAGKLPQVMAALAQQDAEQQFLWAHSAWFWSSNETLRGLCAALGMDSNAILAPDQYV